MDDGKLEYGAIASEEAAKLFNLKILQKDIANQAENFAGFLVCSKKSQIIDSGIPVKTSLVMATAHTAGSLLSALTVFSKYDVNIDKLESRPIIGNPWEEMFIMDVDGHIEDGGLVAAMEILQAHTRELKMLGCYVSDRIDKVKI